MIRMLSTLSRMASIAQNLKKVQERITLAASKRPQNLQYFEPRLVAVGKTKPVDLVIEAYEAGQRHFGENYVVELTEKANDIELQDKCEDIKWHFIGHLQRNKVSKVLDIPNLHVVESVDSPKLAKALNDGWARKNKTEKLHVYAQCNTSREENKSGCAPEEMVDFVKYIMDECPHLQLDGLMTIGVYNFDSTKGPNPDFLALISLREEVSKALNIAIENLELSMGMTADFEQAVELGSNNVRVGTAIFGLRNSTKMPPTEPKEESTAQTSDSNSSVPDIAQKLKDTSISP